MSTLRRPNLYVAAGLTAVLALSPSSFACTTFSFMHSEGIFVGKTYDWGQEQGIIHVNKRGVAKKSLQVFPSDQPMQWQSRYGSVTFNQYGRELPNAGINEAGLVVEVMELDGSSFPTATSLQSVNESQWVQYMLDSAGSVSEMVDLASKLRVSKILVPLHYLACDKTGACVAFEYVDRQLTMTPTAQSGVKVLTNNTYAESLKSLKSYEGFGGNHPIPQGSASLSRFVRAAAYLKTLTSQPTRNPYVFAFDGLGSVANSITRWQVVYDATQRQIEFKTTMAPSVKQINTKDFDFNCARPVVTFNMHSTAEGLINEQFQDYSEAANTALVKQSLGTSVPPQVLKLAIDLPATTRCVTQEVR